MTWHLAIRTRGRDQFPPASRASAGSSSLPSILKAFALVRSTALRTTEVAIECRPSGLIEDPLSAAPSIADAAYRLGAIRNGLVGFHLLCHLLP